MADGTTPGVAQHAWKAWELRQVFSGATFKAAATMQLQSDLCSTFLDRERVQYFFACLFPAQQSQNYRKQLAVLQPALHYPVSAQALEVEFEHCCETFGTEQYVRRNLRCTVDKTYHSNVLRICTVRQCTRFQH